MYSLPPDIIADPYPFYADMRGIPGLYLTPAGTYVASRHADVTAILRDKRFGRAFDYMSVMRAGRAALGEPIFQCMSRCILELDPPAHERIRGLIAQAFTPSRIEDMRPRIQRIVNSIIDSIEADNRADLIADFTPLPQIVICDLLGMPHESRHILIQGAHIGARMLDLLPLSRADLDEQNFNNLKMAAYCRRLFELRRREPRDDLMTHLVQARDEHGNLTDEELTANVLLLLGAGEETTVHLIGNGLLALHRNPDQLELLRNKPELIGNAVAEMLRYDAPVQATTRCTLEPVTVSGTPLSKGRLVICLLGAANRDYCAYAHPNRFDIIRRQVRPRSFGGGIHHCLGSQLARMQAEIAIGTLLQRLPGLQLENLEAPYWRNGLIFRGLSKLDARWY